MESLLLLGSEIVGMLLLSYMAELGRLGGWDDVDLRTRLLGSSVVVLSVECTLSPPPPPPGIAACVERDDEGLEPLEAASETARDRERTLFSTTFCRLDRLHSIVTVLSSSGCAARSLRSHFVTIQLWVPLIGGMGVEVLEGDAGGVNEGRNVAGLINDFLSFDRNPPVLVVGVAGAGVGAVIPSPVVTSIPPSALPPLTPLAPHGSSSASPSTSTPPLLLNLASLTSVPKQQTGAQVNSGSPSPPHLSSSAQVIARSTHQHP